MPHVLASHTRAHRTIGFVAALFLVMVPARASHAAARPPAAPSMSSVTTIVDRMNGDVAGHIAHEACFACGVLPVAYARAGDLALLLPAHHVAAIGYHESTAGSAIEMDPLGRALRNDNRAKIATPAATPGPPYIIMGSRGRVPGATTAADIAMTRGQTVLAPVSGYILSVRAYRLYCRLPDVRVLIVPDGDPMMRVVVLHLRDVRMRAGHRVTAGVTMLGYPRGFGAGLSQIDRYTRTYLPHVHIEVERNGARPLPGC